MKAIDLLGEKRSGTVLSSLLALCIFFFFLTGCKKDVPEPEDIIPPVTLLEASVLPIPDTVPKGSSVYIQWTSNAKSLEIAINGEPQPLFEGVGKKLFVIKVNSSFRFTFTGEKTTPLVLTETRNIIAAEVIIPHPKPTVTLTAPLITEFGTSVSIKLETTDANSVISSLPGVSGTFGNFPTPQLQETTTYTFAAYGEGGVTVDSITIQVEPKKNPFYGYIQAFPWRVIKAEYRYLEGTIWFDGDPSAAILSRKNVFLENLNYEVYQFGILINWGNQYSISDSILIWGGWENKIDTLNQNRMVLEYISCTLAGTDCLMNRVTYKEY